MRVKTYESLKLPTLPKNASEARTFKKRPSSSAIRSLLFEQLKNHPSMMLTIDKFRNASTGSSKRTYQWLYDKLIEAIEIHQLEENSSNLEKSLSQFAKVAASPSKPEKADKPDKSKKEKPEKPNKEKRKNRLCLTRTKSSKTSPKRKIQKSMPPQLPESQTVNARVRRGRDRGLTRAPRQMTSPIVPKSHVCILHTTLVRKEAIVHI